MSKGCPSGRRNSCTLVRIDHRTGALRRRGGELGIHFTLRGSGTGYIQANRRKMGVGAFMPVLTIHGLHSTHSSESE